VVSVKQEEQMIADFARLVRGEISERGEKWRDGALKAQRVMNALMLSASKSGEIVSVVSN
jgi:hypothetical protein